MAISLAEPIPTPRPEWLQSVYRKYQTGEGHAFLLTGPGIHDVDASSYSLHANLYHIFGNRAIEGKPSQLDFDIVVRYDRFSGFRFMGPADKRIKDRETFKSLVEKIPAQSSGMSLPAGGVIRGNAGGASAPKGDILDMSKAPAMAVGLFNEALQQNDVRLCIIFDEFQSLAPRGEWDSLGDMFTTFILALRNWGLDYENIGGHGRKFRGTKGGHILFGICDDKTEISSVLSKGRQQSGWLPINVGFPTIIERECYIREKVLTSEYISRVDIDFGVAVEKHEYTSWLAGATGGLTIRAIEDMRLTGDRHGSLTRDMVQKIINETISEQFAGQGGSDYLRVINPTLGLSDYGFPEYLVDYLEWFVRQFRGGKLRNSNILLSGPPGTGKSVLASSLAFELGYKCVHWNPALTQSKWVGDSEKQLQQVLDWVEANLPCMMFIDEIDVALTSRDGGSIDTSGVGSRMLSILMPWLESPQVKGKLFLVAATNRPDNIDAAMKRRLQTVIPMLPPIEWSDRYNVLLNILERERNIDAAYIEIPQDVVSDKMTKWYTHDNLSVLAEKAEAIASRKGEEFCSDVAGFLTRAVQSYRVDTTRTEALSQLAASFASDLDLLPPGFEVKKQNEVKKILKDVEDENTGPSERTVR